MTIIIDRREEPARHKFGRDSTRFLHRIREAVNKAVQDKVSDSPMSDIGKGGVRVPIPRAATMEPVIHHEKEPYLKKVFPGNLYAVGDVVPIPRRGGGGGNGSGPDAGSSEDGKDDFIVISEEQFLQIFFEGRSLPDMNKLHNESNSVMQRQRFGHTSKGPSHRLNMDITNEKRKGESLVLSKVNERRLISNLTEQYGIYQSYCPELPPLDLGGKEKSKASGLIQETLEKLRDHFDFYADSSSTKGNPAFDGLMECIRILEENIGRDIHGDEDRHRLEVLRGRLPEQMKASRTAENFQTHHLTYRFDKEMPKPSAKAVMFCKMDVSGSMDQEKKNIAKAFFYLLNKFLKSNYEEVDVVYITHTTTAEEVDENEFFSGTRSGGTTVSSCLEKEKEIMQKRYPADQWNIYSAQASDGDNLTTDNAKVETLMREMLPVVQASYFIETPHSRNTTSSLHQVYKRVALDLPNLKTASVHSPGEAVEAFKAFFPVGGGEPANSLRLG